MNNHYEDEIQRSRARRQSRDLTSMNEPRAGSRGGGDRREAPRSRGKYSKKTGVGRGPARPAASTPSGRGGGKKPGMGRAKKIILLAAAECITLSGIFMYAHAAKLWNSVQRPEFQQNNVENKQLDVETIEKMKGYRTIAIFGVDSRGKNVGKGTNADVNMICNINQDTGEIKLVSVFRDTYLNINDNNHYNKLNMAYADGGPEQAVKALNKNLDLNITEYATFNWKAVADGINILGGIDMDISKAEFYYINGFITETVKATGVGSHQLKKAGPQHLDGVQAVAYGRLRLMDTDFARTERQRKVIQKAFDKAKTADFSVLNNIMEVVFPQIATNLTFSDLTEMALMMNKYHIGETGGFPSARSDANMGKKGACVIPATLESNVILLHQFLFGDGAYTPTSAVKTYSGRIAGDTGVYKEGQVVNHVATDGGYIPKATKAPQTKKETETQETEEPESSGASTPGNSNRKPSNETTSAGRPGGSFSGWETWPTDENGNAIDPAWGSQKPGESGSAKPGESTSPTEVVKPGESESSGANPEGPGATLSPSESSAPQPSPGGGSEGPGSQGPGSQGPGASPSPAPSPGSSESDDSATGPGAGNNTGVIIGAPGA